MRDIPRLLIIDPNFKARYSHSPKCHNSQSNKAWPFAGRAEKLISPQEKILLPMRSRHTCMHASRTDQKRTSSFLGPKKICRPLKGINFLRGFLFFFWLPPRQKSSNGFRFFLDLLVTWELTLDFAVILHAPKRNLFCTKKSKLSLLKISHK